MSEHDTLVRVRRLAGCAGLEAMHLAPARVRSVDLATFGVALVAVLSSNDWVAALALAGAVDTIILAHAPSDVDAHHALSAGAVGYLALSLPDATLVQATQRIVAGDAGFSRSVMGRWLRNQRQGGARTAAPSLSVRQHEILQRIAHGDTDKEIAQRLGIATGTVHKHVQRLLERLQVPNRAAAVTRRPLLRTSR